MKNYCLAIAALILVACEGEPPKTPVLPPLPAAAAEPAGAATPAEEPAAAPAALPPCACNCNCAGVAATDAGPPGEGGAPVAAAAAAPAKANISGTITTMPKLSAGHAVVYLEDAPIEPTAKMSATITNRMMNFEPLVSVVPQGGKIIFRNEDPFPHNVFSSDNERFNMGMIPQHGAAARVFKSAGAYTLLCNIHPGMIGYVVSTPSSYFAKTDAQGHFVIKDVPAGTYKVTAWAPREQTATQSVTIAKGDATLDFQLHR